MFVVKTYCHKQSDSEDWQNGHDAAASPQKHQEPFATVRGQERPFL